MKPLIFLLTSIFIITIVSCTHKDEAVTPESLQTFYTYGLQCGWCSGDMELRIDADSTLYRVSPQSFNCDFEHFNELTDHQLFFELYALLDFEAFKQIDIYTSNISSDGCDWYLKITQGSETHQIRYGYNDNLAIQTVLPLIEKLEEVIEGF